MRLTHILLATVVILVLVASAACTGKKKPAPAPGGGQVAPPGETRQPETPAPSEPTEIGEPSGVEGEGETVTPPEGTTTLSAGESLPAGWPSDVPIMEGFKVKGAVSVGDQGEGGAGMSVTAEGSVPAGDVENFYSSLPGWQRLPKMATATGEEGQEATVFTLVKDDAGLTVSIVRSEGVTVLTLAYVPKQ